MCLTWPQAVLGSIRSRFNELSQKSENYLVLEFDLQVVGFTAVWRLPT
jgi:hypothetical protein